MFNRTSSFLFIILFISSFAFAQTDSTMAGQRMMPELTVEKMIFCTGVENREPVGVDTVFADTVGQVYCYTQISGAENPTTISHVWFLNGEEKASIELSVRGETWRTWSSKTIPEEWDGTWRVEVQSATQDVLMSKEFVVR